MSIFETSADCREMKHRTCYGRAWDDATDSEGECQCNCHLPDEAPEEAPADTIRVTVYSKPSGCNQCINTGRAMDRMEIPFTKILVRDEEKTLIDELKREAAALNVPAEMPCVVVYDAATDDTDTWFGYQPDKIRELKGKITNSRKATS
ncbi:glutaredoxin family protein [Glutamicibacter ardleyensis]|uniref:glutaredoxin family protein n=1 Tax=Glutamicibacter ardleyensis TaxID=225894 RepID=UPI003FD41302